MIKEKIAKAFLRFSVYVNSKTKKKRSEATGDKFTKNKTHLLTQMNVCHSLFLVRKFKNMNDSPSVSRGCLFLKRMLMSQTKLSCKETAFQLFQADYSNFSVNERRVSLRFT